MNTKMCEILTRAAIAAPAAIAISLPGAAIVIAAMAVSPALGQCKYELTRLADQGCPYGSVEHVYGMNESGVVVGDAWECFGSNNYAVLWEDPDELVKLSFPWVGWEAAAKDINNAGVIEGFSGESDAHNVPEAFHYDGSQFVQLGTLAQGLGNYSIATAINESGVIVGYSGNVNTGDPPTQPVIWRDGGIMGLLDDLGAKGMAYDVDALGRLVGIMGSGIHIDSHAFIWDDGQVTDLGVVPGGYSASAQGINKRGAVVGYGRVLDPASDSNYYSSRAFLWSGTSMIDLGELPGLTDMRAFAVNDMGQIVGDCNASAASGRAFLWQHGQMIDLNELADTAPDEQLGQAHDINNRGQIAGSTVGAPSGFLLTPLDRPNGDADCDCTVGVHDLLFLLGEWSRTDSPADLDGDGVVDVVDLLLVLADWGLSTAVDTANR